MRIPPVDDDRDLRRRRRRQTQLDICSAALELFEERGVSATSVESIAERAQVSVRTVYRVCGTKEETVLVDDERLERGLLAAVAAIDGDRNALERLEAFWGEVLAQFDEDDTWRERHLRVHHLMASEPTLVAAVLRRDFERGERLLSAIERVTDLPRLHVRVLVDRVTSSLRLTLDEWVRRAPESVAASALYRDVLTAMAEVSPGTPPGGADL